MSGVRAARIHFYLDTPYIPAMATTNVLLKGLPNALTLLRLALAPIVASAIWMTPQPGSWAAIAFGLFLLAALTDLFDGLAARAFDAHSKFGRLIDPIADKALVGLPLIALSALLLAQGAPHAWIAATATAVIVVRDLGITLLRMTSADGEGVRVSALAKWKTTAEMVALGAALAALALQAPWLTYGWLALLVLAAALSAFTAIQYLGALRSART